MIFYDIFKRRTFEAVQGDIIGLEIRKTIYLSCKIIEVNNSSITVLNLHDNKTLCYSMKDLNDFRIAFYQKLEKVG